jgi:hypothetical protein
MLSIALLAALLAALPAAAPAAPVAAVTQDGITVTLYDEPCALTAVANLPYRATWWEARGNFEGCYDVRAHAGVAVIYFDDRTVVVLPLSLFERPASPRPMIYRTRMMIF